MADASLDDFFAKKDKRTKKSKGKLTPTELLVKQESEQQKSQKKKKDKDKSQNRQTQSSSTTGTSTAVAQEDQEWKEFEEETEKDYTGLRIQNLQISKEEEDEESDKRDSDDDGEREEGKDRRDGKEGPWKVSVAAAEPTPQPPPPEPEPAPKVEEPKAAGKYVPPSARYAATASATAPLSQMRRKKGAPNLKSEEDFPTLGGVGGGVGGGGGGLFRWGDSDQGERHFEQVRGGNKQMDEQSSKNMSLTLGNKFQALKQE